MQYRALSLAALASTVAAQQAQNLAATLSATPQLSNLTTFVQSIPGLLETLGNATDITILAPSNAAFSAFVEAGGQDALKADPGLLAAVLQYHVLNGTIESHDITDTPTFAPSLLTNTSYTNVTDGQRVGAVKQNGNVTFLSGENSTSGVETADVVFTGGIVHIIDTVLTLPISIGDTALASNLTAVVGALSQADLVETVNTAPNVTVFVPANQAFEAIASGLGNLTTEQLTAILSYHVVAGTVAFSSELEDNQEIDSLEGSKLTINIEGENIFVNGAAVIQPNILVANGVVHVIDSVLNPDNEDAEPSAGQSAGTPAFTGVSSGALPFTTALPTPSRGGAASSQGATGAAPQITGAVGAAALFGAGAAMLMA